ncbi:hypothetical protein PENTCL1PPCAC_24577, partial [Pristionchus entomophagus]
LFQMGEGSSEQPATACPTAGAAETSAGGAMRTSPQQRAQPPQVSPAAAAAAAATAPAPSSTCSTISEPGSSSSGQGKKVRIGICAMQRKATSKPMRAIMGKIVDYYNDWLEYFVFPEDVILNEPVEKWPLCDCLISFHSSEFPLYKAIEYEKLRRPYVINDLNRQYDLLDRRKVFRELARAGIEHPRHGVVIRDGKNELEGQLIEHADHIEVNGMVFNKPFVEKPISAEDHNVYIYYPSSVGSGSQRLFRKINNRSSWYSPMSEVRKEGSYIYEDFIPADGIDVKVYAVGPYYAHAEARKAPGLDGKVERDADGKEVRYPVILSNKEKMIARKVVNTFKQTVCGFDLLRANGRSYVCDVNGFSFVKTSKKYYEDTAKILGNMIVRKMAGLLSIPYSIPCLGETAQRERAKQPPVFDLGLGDDPPLVSTPSGKLMELRCVLAVIRHGDRTPKQKMKMIVTDDRFFALFRKYDGIKKNEIKMKKPNQLTEVLELSKELLCENQTRRNEFLRALQEAETEGNQQQMASIEHSLEATEEWVKKWDQVRTVLEMYGHFSGINRKVQLKYLKAREVRTPVEGESAAAAAAAKHSSSSSTERKAPPSGPTHTPSTMPPTGPALQLILKWGGELTTAGSLQAEALGKLFRTLYPGIRRTDGKNSPEDTQGLGFLRLHSTYRHDLKIYASDEGRVQTTAAAFAKGLLALDGDLTPILMQMVKSANTDGLLDDDCHARDFQQDLKKILHQALQDDVDWTPDDYATLNPSGLKSINNAMEFIKNPKKMCFEIAGYVKRMVEVIQWHRENRATMTLYLNESWDLAERRWSKELREFKRVNKSGDVEFDISKIPDIYDNIKYDMEHNPDLCINKEEDFERFYLCVKNMADIVVPQEYGIEQQNKILVAQRVCTPLLKKIRNDLHRCIQNTDEEESQTRLDPRASQGIATPLRHVRTRLYFTSESHIHTLMNLIRYGGICTVDDKKWARAMNFLSGVTEFNYMTQVVLMVYEDSSSEAKGMDRFHIELLFSPGLYPCFLTEKERIYENRFNKSNGMTKSHSKDLKDKDKDKKENGDESERERESGSLSPPIRLSSNPSSLMTSSTDCLSVSSTTTPSTIITPLTAPVASTTSLSSGPLSTSPVGGGSGGNSSSTGGGTPSTVVGSNSSHHHESDEELNDHLSVNLVVLDEVHNKPYESGGRGGTGGPEKASEEGDAPRGELKKHSIAAGSVSQLAPLLVAPLVPKTSLAPLVPLGTSLVPAPSPKAAATESCNSDADTSREDHQATVGSGRGKWVHDLLEETKKAMEEQKKKSQQVIQEEEEKKDTVAGTLGEHRRDSGSLEAWDAWLERAQPLDDLWARRSRFPYRFKHHTVNLLTGGSDVDRLISTDVIRGKLSTCGSESEKRRLSNSPAVLSTAVIARSSSAPRLQTYKVDEEISVGEIRRFWPPLRSLETLHDCLSFTQLDSFLCRLLNIEPTPSESGSETERADSVLQVETATDRLLHLQIDNTPSPSPST